MTKLPALINEENELAPHANVEVIIGGVDELLQQIRPECRKRKLLKRVRLLLDVDPGSACQKMFNAAIHDLRSKLIIAGIDIAKEAADIHKLPPVTKAEDIKDNYSKTNILNLSYRVGLLSRAEWKLLKRVYDIRRDLEHDDEEYEATQQDVIYVFRTCVEVVLARDPIELPRVEDVQDIIESPEAITLSVDFLKDFEMAPEPRQFEINKFLINTALKRKNADIVRQNAVESLRTLAPNTIEKVKIDLGSYLRERATNRSLKIEELKVAAAGQFAVYLKQSRLREYFSELYKRFDKAGPGWRQFNLHGTLFDEFQDIGGFYVCPKAVRKRFVKWMVVCYLGERGGYGAWGINRKVFYSNSAAPRIRRIFQKAGSMILDETEELRTNKYIKAVTKYSPIERRFERLIEFLEEDV